MQADPAPSTNDAVQSPRPASDAALRTRSQGGSIITTRELFKSAQEILIDHHGEIYRLRITRNGKLILTK